PAAKTVTLDGDSAMSLDSRRTVLGSTSRPVVTAAGWGTDEARFPLSPHGSHPLDSEHFRFARTCPSVRFQGDPCIATPRRPRHERAGCRGETGLGFRHR